MIGFIDTAAGPVPQVSTRPSRRDHWGTIGARIGLIRRNYKVAPGLYAVGQPSPQSPVLVTANYKLSFDALRHRLSGVDAWMLVLDTRGINVWCASGKGTFSSQEVIDSVKRSRLAEVVSHRELILPQLAAGGVSQQLVRRGCGWSVLWGPIRASDLPAYLAQNKEADATMREVSFTLKERLELIPVELFLLGKPLLMILLVGMMLSGIGPDIFSLTRAWQRGLMLLTATAGGLFAGAVLTPSLLPWLPGRQFWGKGLWAALPVIGCATLFLTALPRIEQAALALWVISVSSYLAMNFTGSTPFTSPSGVEHEMRRGLPLQGFCALLALMGWLAAPFCN